MKEIAVWDPPDLRAGDVDREHVSAVLSAGFAAGRLSKEELDARLTHVHQATYCSELREIVKDLPALGHREQVWYFPSALPAIPPHEILDRAISNRVYLGWRLKHRYGSQAVMVKHDGISPAEHVAHALMTILTTSLWAIVWVVRARKGGWTREVISVDAYGKIHYHRTPKRP
ncbi:DUF1707 SHOCT-like domain-containing protein [Rhizohabitans arisaemae]|uniref:DUF1707 SHOCT-like domain-containing protein n=1 Tax=Rhizohabitans arisaemae TaxID=2720610 RepID=UPI0024B0BED8|nr:DUF1707 domain-containing protein [Rhizohabitans arisaemae]